MHIPDGFIDIPTSAAFAVASAVAVAGAVKGARKQLSEQSAPLAGLTAVFIFAVQMLNFPVAAGTSGHLIGAALAMVLVGPYAATLALVVVLIIQAFLFADGGLTALGLSIFNMAIISVWVSFIVFMILKKILPRTKSWLVAASFISALISVPAAAIGFVIQYAIGANATFSVGTVLNAMVGTHILIGIGEAIITALTVSAVLASRSDLVFGWDRKNSQLEIRS
ncbi:MAG: energy-coupling factor ABC transporter permease [Candidatus Nanopelagicus sp.]